MLHIALCVVLCLLPACRDARAEPEGTPAPQDAEVRLKQLAQLLQSFSDEEYRQALGEMPKEAAESPALASRSAALRSVYTNLAAFKYNEASHAAPAEAAGSYSDAYRRLDAKAVAIDPVTLQETGWGKDVLKWLATTGIKYAVYGALMAVSRPTQPDAAGLDQSLDGLETELAGAEISPERKAAVQYKMGSIYEGLAAAAAKTESEAERTAKKKDRLRELAGILETLSDEDYQEALAQVPDQTADRPELASRGAILKSAYVTLAALEYRDAARSAPQEASARYTGDLNRLSREEAKNLAINPVTLQETGWATKLLGVAALGGIGYAVYKNREELGIVRQRREETRVPPQPPPPPPDPIPDTAPDTRPVPLPGPLPKPEPTPRCPTGQTWGEAPWMPRMMPSCGPREAAELCAARHKAARERTRGRCIPIVITPPPPQRKGGTYIVEIPVSARVSGLYESLDGLEGRLASAELSADQTAELRHQMGSLYERLADAATTPKAAPPEPEPEKPAKETARELDSQEKAMRKQLDRDRARNRK